MKQLFKTHLRLKLILSRSSSLKSIFRRCLCSNTPIPSFGRIIPQKMSISKVSWEWGKMRVLFFYAFCYGVLSHQHHANDAIMVILLFGIVLIIPILEFISSRNSHNELLFSILWFKQLSNPKSRVFFKVEDCPDNSAQTKTSNWISIQITFSIRIKRTDIIRIEINYLQFFYGKKSFWCQISIDFHGQKQLNDLLPLAWMQNVEKHLPIFL